MMQKHRAAALLTLLCQISSAQAQTSCNDLAGASVGNYGSNTWMFPEGFFRDYVHADPAWTVRDFDLQADIYRAQRGVIGVAVYAEDTDLSRFRDAGGKLILWHGRHDMGIPAANTVRYFNDVQLTMAAAGPVDDFMRLFLGTGVDHCGGGVGPDVISGVAAPGRDPQHDIVEALVAWVKQGRAPNAIVASKVNKAGEVVAQRPWCAYPAVARWDGHGDRRERTSYRCETPVAASASLTGGP